MIVGTLVFVIPNFSIIFGQYSKIPNSGMHTVVAYKPLTIKISCYPPALF